ncbi:MAG: glutamyl-tRNA reductase [Gemmatimonadota bacterium]|nr:glutamyl-tRNA reductase [Gemmatimonadota bacterium]MDH5759905.1 glutamyl-tRNA reductase [Gemmatimonadota bacterium]
MVNLFVLGTSHSVASASLREQMHVEAHRIRSALAELTGPGCLMKESLVLATCARLEVYGVAEHPWRATRMLQRLMARETGIPVEKLEEHSYSLTGEEAVMHAFRVAGGLESVVQGEAQILGQVRDSLGGTALGETAGPMLNRLIQSAVGAGKRVRTETEIGRGAASLAGASVQLLQRRIGKLEDLRVLVLGAGDTGALIAGLLKKAGVTRIAVANRTLDRAEKLAHGLGATAHTLDQAGELLSTVDLVVGAVTAPDRILDAEPLRDLRAAGKPIPSYFLDLAHPRNFHTDIDEMDGVEVFDLEIIHQRVAEAKEARCAQVPLAEAIVVEEVERYVAWARTRGAVPVVKAVREHVLELAAKEVDRHGRGLGQAERELLERFAHSLTRTILHRPTVALREADPHSEEGRAILASVETIFGLDATEPAPSERAAGS